MSQIAPRLRVEPGGQLVEQDDFRIVNQGKGDEETLLLSA
jgi:hypothetical protein